MSISIEIKPTIILDPDKKQKVDKDVDKDVDKMGDMGEGEEVTPKPMDTTPGPGAERDVSPYNPNNTNHFTS